MKQTYIKPIGASGWTNVKTAWGMALEDGSISKLLTPAGTKAFVYNDSELENGKRLIRSAERAKLRDRDVTIVVHFTGSSESDFLGKYNSFCQDVLAKGGFDLKTDMLPNMVFRLTYIDCTQFAQTGINQGGSVVGKFTLTLNEPDPTNRSESDSWDNT